MDARRFMFSALAALLLTGTYIRADEEAVDDSPPPKEEVEESRPRLSDPFSMRGANFGGDDFVPTGSAALPPGIRVVSILTPRDGEPIGAISIPGEDDLQYVREGDVVQVEFSERVTHPSRTEARTGRRDADTPRTATFRQQQETRRTVYLLIVSVDADKIEIAPRARPSDTRIYR